MAEDVAARHGQTIAAIERAADVLTLFSDPEQASLGVTEIARRLGLSKAVVHRILASFRSRGYIEIDDETRRYQLGPSALTLGLAYLERLDVAHMARGALEELSRATDETATLSLRLGDHSRVYVDQVSPARDIKMVVQLGQPFPLHAGGSGKAFLAFLPPAAVGRYLGAQALEAVTAFTITDEAVLRAELSRVAERGYAVSHGERQVGAGSVAAPIFDRHGEPVAVLSVCGPVERFRDEVDGFAPLLLGTTRALSARMGFPSPHA